MLRSLATQPGVNVVADRRTHRRRPACRPRGEAPLSPARWRSAGWRRPPGQPERTGGRSVRDIPGSGYRRHATRTPVRRCGCVRAAASGRRRRSPRRYGRPPGRSAGCQTHDVFATVAVVVTAGLTNGSATFPARSHDARKRPAERRGVEPNRQLRSGLRPSPPRAGGRRDHGRVLRRHQHHRNPAAVDIVDPDRRADDARRGRGRRSSRTAQAR